MKKLNVKKEIKKPKLVIAGSILYIICIILLCAYDKLLANGTFNSQNSSIPYFILTIIYLIATILFVFGSRKK